MHFAICLFTPQKLVAAPADEPPVVGQPDNFSGAVGLFRITTSAAPAEVPEGDPVLFRVRISSKGPVLQAPARPNLRKLKAFTRRFVIQDLPALDTFSPGQWWEYQYHLKPRSLEVHEIPPLLFVYYKPGVIPREKGYWTTASPSIPLTVKPRGKATLVDSDGKPIRPPAQFFRFITGDAVLRRDRPESLPAGMVLFLMVVTPPALCLVWYQAWRRTHPNGAVLAGQRRSRAAQNALRSLRKIGGEPAEIRASRATETIATYLMDRFEIAAAALAPAELLEQLKSAGCPKTLMDDLMRYLRTCDAVRYAADHAMSIDLVKGGEQLIHAMEDQWTPATNQPARTVVPQVLLAVSTVLALPQMADRELLQQAEQAFQQGIETTNVQEQQAHLRAAVTAYEQLRQRGVNNAALHLNLGNAHVLADDMPQAVLAYRRGLRLAPGDADLRANLAYVRSQVPHSTNQSLGRPPVDHWPPGVPYPTIRFRLLIMMIFYSLGCVAVTGWFMTRQGRMFAGAILLSAGVFTLAGSAGHEARLQRYDAEHPIVVLAPRGGEGVLLRKGNGFSYPALHDTPLSGGVEARLLFQRGDWLQIHLAGGEVGWVPAEAALVDS